jgi:hypothetical protein
MAAHHPLPTPATPPTLANNTSSSPNNLNNRLSSRNTCNPRLNSHTPLLVLLVVPQEHRARLRPTISRTKAARLLVPTILRLRLDRMVILLPIRYVFLMQSNNLNSNLTNHVKF